MKADFHCHSRFSDGDLNVDELFKLADERGLDYFAITDHDNINSIEVANKIKDNYHVKYIPGLELSTYYNDKPIHLLGYFNDITKISDEFKKHLDFMKQNRLDRAKKYIDNLNRLYNLGLKIEEIPHSDGVIARPHIAAIICEKEGITRDEAFQKYLLDSNPAFVPTYKLPVEEGFKMLKDNHAMVVMAHPGKTKRRESIYEILDMISPDGIEINHPSHSEEDKEEFKNLALSKGMICSAGSDFHRYNDQAHALLGTCVIYDDDVTKFLDKFKEER